MTHLQTPELHPCNAAFAGARGRRGDSVRFLRSWLQNPLRTAAIAPSGRVLATLMTKDIAASTDRVIELGPGTGVFTRALLGRGIPAGNLTLLESNPDFADLVRSRFPDAHVVCADAAQDLWQVPEDAEVGAVVSGLPMLSMTSEDVASVLANAFTHLAPAGRFYQFTYARRCPVRTSVLDALSLEATCVGRTFRNLPPASVYRITRRPDPTLA